MSAAASTSHLVRHFSNFTKLLRSVLHTACCKIGHGATVLLQLQWQQILPHIVVVSSQVVCSLSLVFFWVTDMPFSTKKRVVVIQPARAAKCKHVSRVSVMPRRSTPHESKYCIISMLFARLQATCNMFLL